jgi:hypothetical protein
MLYCAYATFLSDQQHPTFLYRINKEKPIFLQTNRIFEEPDHDGGICYSGEKLHP